MGVKRFWIVLVLLGCRGLLAAEEAPPTVHLVGSFNRWNVADPQYRMEWGADSIYRLKHFFRAGKYRFKFAVDGSWEKVYGAGTGGRLAQPGKDIELVVPRSGAWVISFDLQRRRWGLIVAELGVPQAVLDAYRPVEANIPITLDGAGSVARPQRKILAYDFGEQSTDPVQAEVTHTDGVSPQATVILPEVGTYRFWLQVNDGLPSDFEFITLKAQRSYQLVGLWTASVPGARATWMQRTSLGRFEKVLPPTVSGEQQLILVRDHDPGKIIAHLLVDVPATNRQFWVARYDEAANQLTCQPEALVEFRFTPAAYPALWNQTIRSVNLAGSFNGWNSQATPMLPADHGQYVAHLKLEDGLYHYKFVVNGDIWLPDPQADARLANDDEHGGQNSGIYIGECGEDYGTQPLGEINLKAVRHDPHQLRYFSVAGDYVEVTLRALVADAARVGLCLAGSTNTIPMRRVETRFGFDYWQTTFLAPPDTNTVSYYFSLVDGSTTDYFGTATDKEQPHGVVPFTTALAKRSLTPAWAKHVVWYEIMPDRFANGASANDVPHTLPWTWNWYQFADWEHPNANRTFSVDWYNRWFGGDFQGLIQRLPYFHQLGVTALYLTPVFESRSYHGYDTTDYRHIASHFGFLGDDAHITPPETLDTNTWQWTESDKLFLDFIRQAHGQGLKVIIDAVFNHMGKKSFALQDVLTNGVKSVYADWFDIADWGPPVQYNSWDGGGWMPNFRKDAENGIASASARQYLFNITRRWMAPNGNPADGVDGWRLDVATDIPAPFWIAWRKLVKSINPQAFITGEDWGIATKHLQGDQWDAAMNYQFAVRAVRYFINRKQKLTASEFDLAMRRLLDTYPLQADMVMQNLYDSHDTDRLVNMIANPDRPYDQGDRPQDGAPYNGNKPGPEAYRILKQMITFQMTFPGAPMIWYGDEAGLYGADDPTNRKPMLWKDLQPYRDPSEVFMADVWNYYRRLIAIRNTYPVLRAGLYQPWFTDDKIDLYGFLRVRGDDMVAILFNNGDTNQDVEVKVPFPDDTKLVDVIAADPATFVDQPMNKLGFADFPGSATVSVIHLGADVTPVYRVHDSRIRVNLPAKSSAVLVKQ